MRAGAHGLSLLAVPLNVDILLALGEEPKSLVDIRKAAGSPPQTTMRGHMKALEVAGILERRRLNDFPGSVDCDLGPAGRDLLEVAAVLRTWLERAPDGPIDLGSFAAKSVITALTRGWSAAIVRVLAARAVTLTDLSRLISGFSYPSLERRLGAMRLAGQIEPCPSISRGTPYRAATWLRQAIAPLAAAARWERQHLGADTPAIGKIDIEAAFLLALPLARVSAQGSGVCRLVVEGQGGDGESKLAGVMAKVAEGRVASCMARLQGEASCSASGSATAWLDALAEADPSRLNLGGDTDLALRLLGGVREALYGVRDIA